MEMAAKIREDFDKLAVFDAEGWNHNNHYHPFLLQHMPPRMDSVLEIGCGTGEFARLLARRADAVLAMDLSPQMVRIARERSGECANIEYQVADILAWEMPETRFDCIASIATLHHLPLEDVLPKLKQGLRPGGLLLILDLVRSDGWRERSRDALAVLYNLWLRLRKARHVRHSPEARQAWAEHGATDHYLTLEQVRAACSILPGALIKAHLLWRYSVVWTK